MSLKRSEWLDEKGCMSALGGVGHGPPTEDVLGTLNRARILLS